MVAGTCGTTGIEEEIKERSLKLSEITSLNRFANDIADGWIRVSGIDNGLVIFTYTQRTQFAGHWVEDTTLLARGLVVHLTGKGAETYRRWQSDWNQVPVDVLAGMLEDGEVRARGMRKFFTVSAANSEWGKLKLVDDDENIIVNDSVSIDYDAPASVSDKIDGALGIGVPVGGDYVIVTKGAFHSDEAIAGTRFMQGKHDSRAFCKFMTENLPGYTPLFEIITPNDRHIIRYGSMSDLVFLGLVEQRTGWWIPAALLPSDIHTSRTDAGTIPSRFGFRTPEVYSAASLGEALALPALDNHEGMVVTLNKNAGGQDMFKIKYPTYLLLSRLKNQMSDKALRDLVQTMPATAIMSGGTPDIMLALPESAREAAKDIVADISSKARALYVEPIRRTVDDAIPLFNKLAENCDLSAHDGVKEFALKIQALQVPREIKNVLFALKTVAAKGETDALALRDTAVEAAKKGLLKPKTSNGRKETA